MSIRLQVVMDEEEFGEIRAFAQRRKLTVAAWVREALRQARQSEPRADTATRLEAIRAAARYAFPAGNIDQMLAEVEQGRSDAADAR